MRIRRVLEVVGGVLLGLSLLIVLALGGSILWLRSDGGQAFMRRQIGRAADEKLGGAGRVTLERVSGSVTRGLVLHDVVVRDAHGQLAARVGEVALHYRLLPLLRGQVDRVAIVRPRVDVPALLRVARGMPKRPSKRKLSIPNLQVKDGSVWAAPLPGGAATVRGLEVDAAIYLGRDSRAELRSLRGQVERAGTTLPLAARGRASWGPGYEVVPEMSVSLGGAQLVASGSRNKDANGNPLRAQIARLRLPAGWLPSGMGPLVLTGDLSGTEHDLAWSAHGRLGGRKLVSQARVLREREVTAVPYLLVEAGASRLEAHGRRAGGRVQAQMALRIASRDVEALGHGLRPRGPITATAEAAGPESAVRGGLHVALPEGGRVEGRFAADVPAKRGEATLDVIDVKPRVLSSASPVLMLGGRVQVAGGLAPGGLASTLVRIEGGRADWVTPAAGPEAAKERGRGRRARQGVRNLTLRMTLGGGPSSGALRLDELRALLVGATGGPVRARADLRWTPAELTLAESFAAFRDYWVLGGGTLQRGVPLERAKIAAQIRTVHVAPRSLSILADLGFPPTASADITGTPSALKVNARLPAQGTVRATAMIDLTAPTRVAVWDVRWQGSRLKGRVRLLPDGRFDGSIEDAFLAPGDVHRIYSGVDPSVPILGDASFRGVMPWVELRGRLRVGGGTVDVGVRANAKTHAIEADGNVLSLKPRLLAPQLPDVVVSTSLGADLQLGRGPARGTLVVQRGRGIAKQIPFDRFFSVVRVQGLRMRTDQYRLEIPGAVMVGTACATAARRRAVVLDYAIRVRQTKELPHVPSWAELALGAGRALVPDSVISGRVAWREDAPIEVAAQFTSAGQAISPHLERLLAGPPPPAPLPQVAARPSGGEGSGR